MSPGKIYLSWCVTAALLTGCGEEPTAPAPPPEVPLRLRSITPPNRSMLEPGWVLFTASFHYRLADGSPGSITLLGIGGKNGQLTFLDAGTLVSLSPGEGDVSVRFSERFAATASGSDVGMEFSLRQEGKPSPVARTGASYTVR